MSIIGVRSIVANFLCLSFLYASAAFAQELAVNGGFEQSATGWFFSGGGIQSTAVNGGTKAAFVGGDSKFDYFYQDIFIPTDASTATLRYWWNIVTEEGPGTVYDRFHISVRTIKNEELLAAGTLTNLNAPGDNTFQQSAAFNLIAYKGQTVRVTFRAETDSSLASTLRIDDVSLQVTIPSPAPDIRVSPGTVYPLPGAKSGAKAAMAQAIKPARTVVSETHERRRITVKFRDGLTVRARNGRLTERGTNALQSSANVLAKFGNGWLRVDALPEERIDAMRATAERRIGRALPDLNLQFDLQLPAGMDAAAACDELNKLESVELAQPIPLAQEPPSISVKDRGAAPPPLPGDYVSFQGYLNSAPDGVGAKDVWQDYGTKGTGIKVCDIEYVFNPSHQDLPAVGIVGPTPVDPGYGHDHATAVLGEIFSKSNSFGTTGIAHEAQAFFAGAYDGESYVLSSALTDAADALDPGDVILIEQQIDGPGASGDDYVPVEWFKPYYDRIVTAVGLGITVVEAGANGYHNLDAPIFSTGNGGHWPFLPQNNSGAILVGAGCAPPAFGGDTSARSRLDYSSYGSRVDVQGWGYDVTTTGYGSLYSAEGVNLYYVRGFSGTSSASPIVTGAVALLQSAYKAETGTVLTPAQVRQILKDTGTPQQSGEFPFTEHIGPLPNALAAIDAALAEPERDEFVIYNDGSVPLNVTSITPNAAAAWIDWSPQAPFNVPATSSVTVTVTIDWDLVPNGETTRQLLIASSDTGETPYPGAVYVTTDLVAETMTTPGAPSGEGLPTINVNYQYSTSGATSTFGHTAEYQFNWGDGTTSAWSTSTSASHSWSTLGQKSVTVTARCQTHTNITAQSSATNITVQSPETVSQPGAPSGNLTPVPNQNYIYTTTGATSNNGHVLEYRFNWGDGTSSAWSTAKSAQHAWTTNGQKSITIDARCQQHTDKTNTSAATVVEVMPAETVSKPGAPTGELVPAPNQDYAYATTGATSNLGHEIEYQFSWGDGSFSDWSSSTSASHAWANDGARNVTVTARCKLHTEKTNTSSATTVQVVTPEVISAPGAPQGALQTSTNVMQSYTTAAATSNLGHAVEYQFFWGDGSVSPWSSATNASHAWTSAGMKNVIVTARCKLHTDSLENSDIVQVEVKAPEPVRVVWPNGGETWNAGTKKKVKWKPGDAGCAEVRIELWRNGSFTRNLKTKTANDGKQKVKLPDSVATGADYKVRIVCTTNPSNSDMSNGNVSIGAR